MADVDTLVDHLQEADGLLRRGGWVAARAAYARLLTGQLAPAGEAAAAEGLARAAWWLDDDTASADAFERAYRCHRAAGDDRGAARVAAWLGNAALQLRGEAAVAQGWFRRADRLLADQPADTEEHALLALFVGMTAHLRGAHDEAIEHASRTMRIARRLRSPDLEIQGMALSGIAHVATGRIGEGMGLLDEAAAAALAGEVDEVGSVWLPSCFLVQGCERARDWERAEQWCTRIMEFCCRFDLGSPFSRCRAHYGTVLLWRCDWAGAESQLVRAAEELRAQRPYLAADAWARLGELRRRQGRRDEATELFALARTTPTALLGRAELDEDRPASALEHARLAVDGTTRQDLLGRAPLLEVLARAAAAAVAHVSRLDLL